MSTLRERLEAAETRLKDEQRGADAMREWFLLSERPDLPTSGTLYTVEVNDSISVRIRGLTRACGGVAVVCCGDFRDYPRRVDDLIAEWREDPRYDIRDAARRIQSLRENVLNERDTARKVAA